MSSPVPDAAPSGHCKVVDNITDPSQLPQFESVGINYFPFLVELALVLLFVLNLLRTYLSYKRTPIWVSVVASLGFALAFCLTLLMPLDIAMAQYNYCLIQHDGVADFCQKPWNYVDRSILRVVWSIIYWVMFTATWAVYPLGQSYVSTGEFTFWRKVRASFVDNLIFYAMAIIPGIIFFVVLFLLQGKNLDSTISVALTLANSWGMFLLVTFMGVGLVEIPRNAWRKGNLAVQLRLHHFKAASGYEELSKAHEELFNVEKQIKKLDEIVSRGDENRRYLDALIEECTAEYHMLDQGEGKLPSEYSSIVSLRAQLRSAKHNWNQANALYEASLQTAFQLDDVIQSREYKIKNAIKWTYTAPRHLRWDPVTRTVNFFEWVWWTYLCEWFWRGLSVVMGAMSLILIYCEVTMFVVFLEKEDDRLCLPPTISPLTLLVRVPHLSAFAIEVISFCVLVYMAVCTFSSLFDFKLLSWYRLLPNQMTDSYSIMFCAAYLSRLSPPMVLNFLYLINFDSPAYNAAYIEVMGPMIKVPFFGERFNIIFPILILLVVLATIFSCWSRFMSIIPCCKYRSFSFDEWDDDEFIEKGKDLITKEREARRKVLAQQILAADPNAVVDLESPGPQDEYERKRHLREQIRQKIRYGDPSAKPAVTKSYLLPSQRGKAGADASTSSASTSLAKASIRSEPVDAADLDSRLDSWFGRREGTGGGGGASLAPRASTPTVAAPRASTPSVSSSSSGISGGYSSGGGSYTSSYSASSAAPASRPAAQPTASTSTASRSTTSTPAKAKQTGKRRLVDSDSDDDSFLKEDWRSTL